MAMFAVMENIIIEIKTWIITVTFVPTWFVRTDNEDFNNSLQQTFKLEEVYTTAYSIATKFFFVIFKN